VRLGPLGFWELLVLAALILFLFNAPRLRRLGQAIRRSRGEFRRGAEEARDPPRLPDGSTNDTNSD